MAAPILYLYIFCTFSLRKTVFNVFDAFTKAQLLRGTFINIVYSACGENTKSTVM